MATIASAYTIDTFKRTIEKFESDLNELKINKKKQYLGLFLKGFELEWKYLLKRLSMLFLLKL